MANFLYLPKNGGSSQHYDDAQLLESPGAQTPEFQAFVSYSSAGDHMNLLGGTFVRLGSEFRAPA